MRTKLSSSCPAVCPLWPPSAEAVLPQCVGPRLTPVGCPASVPSWGWCGLRHSREHTGEARRWPSSSAALNCRISAPEGAHDLPGRGTGEGDSHQEGGPGELTLGLLLQPQAWAHSCPRLSSSAAVGSYPGLCSAPAEMEPQSARCSELSSEPAGQRGGRTRARRLGKETKLHGAGPVTVCSGAGQAPGCWGSGSHQRRKLCPHQPGRLLVYFCSC